MSRRRLIAALFLVLAVVVLAVALWPDRRDPVSRAIRDRVAGSPDQPIELAALGDGDWDRVHFFPPYTTRLDVEAALGVTWPKLGGSDVEASENVTLVVFLKGGQIVRSFDHPRADGDFAAVQSRVGLGRDQARFVVQREGEGRRVMKHAPAPAGPPEAEPVPVPDPAPDPVPEPTPETGPATVPVVE